MLLYHSEIMLSHIKTSINIDVNIFFFCSTFMSLFTYIEYLGAYKIKETIKRQMDL